MISAPSIVAMHLWGMKFSPYRGVGLIYYTKRVLLGLSEVAFIEGCPHVRGGLYEGFHCSCLSLQFLAPLHQLWL